MLLRYVFSACILCVLKIKGMIIKWNKHKLVHASFLLSFLPSFFLSFEQIKCDELGEYMSRSILSSSVVYIFTTTLSLSLSLILSISLPWGPGHPLPYDNYYPSCVPMFIYQIFGLYGSTMPPTISFF